jgi:hypothetical protein
MSPYDLNPYFATNNVVAFPLHEKWNKKICREMFRNKKHTSHQFTVLVEKFPPKREKPHEKKDPATVLQKKQNGTFEQSRSGERVPAIQGSMLTSSRSNPWDALNQLHMARRGGGKRGEKP